MSVTPRTDASASRPESPTRSIERLGRYGLLAPLGQGGMGTIHLAVASGLGEFRKLLVVKELRRDLTRNGKFVDMFLAEAKLAARLDHPNIVQTLEAGQDGDRYFIAMEFLDGQPFNSVLRRAELDPPIPMAMRLQMLSDVLAGLHYAHELRDYDDTPLQIVHRDVSPQNVFVTYHGQVKVVDFGVAKAIDIEPSTGVGVFKGKFAYAAPEQVKGMSVDRRSDVFAVGVMLWEVLAQRRFAPGGPTQTAIEARLTGSEPRIATILPQLDPVLVAISNRSLAVDPAERYPTAEAFRGELDRYLSGRGERYQASAIGTHVRERFIVERTAVGQLINAEVRKHTARDDTVDTSASVQSALRVAAPYGEQNQKTTLGFLSKKVETGRTDVSLTGSSRGGFFPWKGLRAWQTGSLLVAAAAAFFAAYMGVRWHTAPGDEPPNATPESANVAEAQRPAPPVVEPQAPTLTAPTPQLTPSSEDSAKAIAKPRRRTGPVRKATADDDATREKTLAAESDTSARPRAVVRSEASLQPSASPQLGDDLRARRRARDIRPIEREDPFH